jgi:ACS family tartrate transporter-like MFS transporter
MIEPTRILRRTGWRLVPFLMLLYFANFLDRVNVGFAALSMNRAIGLTPTLYGWGAGIFFIGYFLFEVPSNLILARVGARLWIARIMVSWGIVSAAMALTSGPASFIALRFLLGVAEAGFFPGIILYLSFWFPAASRARIIAAFMAAIPLSSIVGNPLSGWIVSLGDLGGIDAWRWLFVLEGVPAALLGIAVLLYLPDGPAEARWLAPEERDWLVATLRAETQPQAHRDLRRSLSDPRVLLLAAIYGGFVIGLYGIALWLPQIIQTFGAGDRATGFLAAIPYGFAAIGMVLWGCHSDQRGERRRHIALAGVIAAAGLTLAAIAPPALSLLAICAAAFGIYAAIPLVWTLPGGFLTGAAAAGAIALVNSIGNLGGFIGPYLVGWIREATGSFAPGLMVLAAACLAAGLLALAAPKPPPGAAADSC